MDSHKLGEPVTAVTAGRSGRSRRPVHPAVVTIPIGCWMASLVFDIASRIVAAPAFLTRSSTWLVGIGLLGAVIASLTGFRDALAIPVGTKASRTAATHMALAMLAIVLYVTGYLVRLAAPVDQPVSVPLIALSLLSALVLAATGFAGGTLAYRHGVGVARDRG